MYGYIVIYVQSDGDGCKSDTKLSVRVGMPYVATEQGQRPLQNSVHDHDSSATWQRGISRIKQQSLDETDVAYHGSEISYTAVSTGRCSRW